MKIKYLESRTDSMHLQKYATNAKENLVNSKDHNL